MVKLQPILVFHGRHFVRHLGICNRICVLLLQLMYAVIAHNSVKKRSICVTKMAELQPIIVFHGRPFVPDLGICNPICAKLLQIMSGVIPRNLKEVSISNRFPEVHKRGIYTQTHTNTHTHTYTHTHTRR